mmetsp:Transcript_19051/g.31585  ORF Transcript_19051/g.31585 Transcript_19051/m.31585 type:complete len:106 (+) Transcript_19051:193-510(+)
MAGRRQRYTYFNCRCCSHIPGSGHEEAEAASAAASYTETQNTGEELGEGFVQLHPIPSKWRPLVLFCQGQHLCWKWEMSATRRGSPSKSLALTSTPRRQSTASIP